MSRSQTLVKHYFSEHSAVASNIASFNHFIDNELQRIIEDNKIVEPTIIPPNVESFKIRLDKIWVKKPEIVEADGSRRNIYPMEARLRRITYAAPVYIEISSHINGVQRESFQTQIGSIPIMLKSNNCHLSKMSREELIKIGEDPNDPGGYFVVQGTERVVINVEDLAANRLLVDRASTGPSKFVGKVFSEHAAYKILHSIEQLKDGIFYISFTRIKRLPIILLLKALGMTKDEEIMQAICSTGKQYDSVITNLFEFVNVKTEEDAFDQAAKTSGITQTKELRLERMQEIVDKYLFPHIGVTSEARYQKALNLCKMVRKFLAVSQGELPVDDKDHYTNKRLKMSGDLLADLFRVNLKVLIGDLLYNFQRIVKRGKFPSIKVIIRHKLLTSRMYSSMATGNWVGGRKGISQRIQRLNHLNTLSHLQRVVSPLAASQENFAARALHATHMGRLCVHETPEGTNIGLRKNLALLASASSSMDETNVLRVLRAAGLQENE